MREIEFMKNLQVKLSKLGIRLFRNNTGLAYQGSRVTPIGSSGDIILSDARVVHMGLCKGSSDLIGWKTIKITPDMVGTSVAVFTAIETKSKNGRATPEQTNFIAAVTSSGGIAFIAKPDTDISKFL